MNARTGRRLGSSLLRTLTVTGFAALLVAACAAASPQQAAQDEARTAQMAAESAKRDAELKAQAANQQALDESATARGRARDAATARMQAERSSKDPLDGMRSVVVPVNGHAEELAHALRDSLMATVTATPLGNSVVLTGEPKRVEAAVALLVQLNESATGELDRKRAELMAEQEMKMVEAQRRMSAADRVFDVTLEGSLESSLNHISDSLTKAGGQGLNIVFTNVNDAKLPVRTVGLKRVSLGAALHTLESLQVDATYGPQVRIEIGRSSNPEERPVVTVTPSPSSRHSMEESLYHTAVFRVDALGDNENSEDRARVEKRQKDSLDAIAVGLDIAGKTPEFKIKLHPETGMMFVHGTRAQINIVAEVLGQDDPTAPNPFGGPPRANQPTPTPTAATPTPVAPSPAAR